MQIAPLLAVLIMPFRRHLGVLMFLCVFIHFSLTTQLPVLVSGVIPPLNAPKLFGFGAMLLLFPLWLTSNDTSQRFSGKY